MLNLTRQEKTVLAFIAAALLAGSAISLTFKRYPELRDIVNLIDGNKLYSKIDVNRATVEELVELPYIGEYTARNIIKYRSENGFFSTVEELKKVKGIKEKNFLKFSPYIKVSE